MTWKIIPEGSSRTIALEAGEIDMVIEVEAMDAERIEANEELDAAQARFHCYYLADAEQREAWPGQ